MTSDYRPIACGAYDEIEVLAMRRTAVQVLSRDDKGQTLSTGRLVDTAIHDGAEYLVLLDDGCRHEIRLDQILQIDDMSGQMVWRR